MLRRCLSNAIRSLGFSAVILSVLAGTAHAGQFAYITNQDANTVSVINIATNTEVLPSVPVGTRPIGVAVNPVRPRVYVTNQLDGTVSVIDTATNTEVLPRVTVGAGPLGIAVTPDGRNVYVANETSRTVSVIDADTNAVVTIPLPDVAPKGVAIGGTRFGMFAYVTACFGGGGNLQVINTETGVVKIVELNLDTRPFGDCPTGVAVKPDGTRVYAVNPNFGTVSVIDTETGPTFTELTTVPMPGSRHFLRTVAVNPLGTLAYVTDSFSSTVSVFDTFTNLPVIDTATNRRRALLCGEFKQQQRLGDQRPYPVASARLCEPRAGAKRPSRFRPFHRWPTGRDGSN
jgi:YVTN family beta-propeller protein